jgi:two-component system LytT family response regulator
MTTLIIDDERLARSELKRLLKAHPQIQVLGEASDAEEALRKILQLKPDLLFLDIQMPGKTGFDLIRELPTLPKVIFTTAFDEYALKAFEFNAFDYLLKPIESFRLALSIQRLQIDTVKNEPDTFSHLEREILDENDQVFLKENDQCFFVRIKDIRMFESEGNYARIYHGDQKLLVYRSLNNLETRLNPSFFFRASRTHIINLKQVESVEDCFDCLVVKLSGGLSVKMSRRKSQLFRQRLTL